MPFSQHIRFHEVSSEDYFRNFLKKGDSFGTKLLVYERWIQENTQAQFKEESKRR